MDLAKVYIQAKDESGPAFESFKRNTMSAGDAFNKFKGFLAGAGISLSAGFFANLVKGSIDAMDRMRDLSITTDIFVGKIAGLSLAAKQSGGDLESIAASINKLGVNMGKDSDKFKALGITAKEPLEAFKQLSDIFVQIEDPQLRAALGAAALGKSWAGAAPLLAEGGDKIQEMVDKGERLSGITKENTDLADAFNDKLAELTGTGRGLTMMITPLLPLLNEMADQLLEGQKNADKANGSYNLLAEAFRAIVVLGGNVSFVLKGIGNDLGGLAAQFVTMHQAQAKFLTGDFSGGMADLRRRGAISEAMSKDGASRRADFDSWEKRMMTVGTLDTSRDNWDMMGKPRRGNPDIDKLARGFVNEDKAGGSGGDDFVNSTMRDLENQIDRMSEGGLSKFDELMRKVIASGKAFTQEQELMMYAAAGTLDVLIREKAALKDLHEEMEREAKLKAEVESITAAYNQRILDTGTALDDAIESLKFETTLIGKNSIEREKAIALRNLEAKSGLLGESSTAQFRKRLEDAYRAKGIAEASLESHKKSLEEFNGLWSTVERTGKDVFVNLFSSGKNAFDGIGKAIKASVIDLLYQLTARKWIISIGTSIAGSLGLSGTANASGGGIGGIGNLFSMGNSASNFFAGAGLGSIGELGAGVAGLGTEAGLFTAASEIAGGAAGMSGALGGLGVLGPIGLGIGALGLLGAFGGSGKTPAVLTGIDMPGGSVGYGAGLSGAYFGNDSNQGYRWQGGSVNNIFVESINQVYDQIADISEKLGRNRSSVYGFSASYSGAVPTGEDWTSLGPALMAQVSDQLARQVIPNLSEFAQANETATQTLTRLIEVQEQLRKSEQQQMAQIAASVRGLPGQLGITGLTDAQHALAVSEFQSPLSRLGASRSLLDSTFASAMGGDLDAVRQFPQVLQQALGIGREVGASGSAFQSLFTDGNRQLNDILAKQRSIEAEFLAEVPASIIQASTDQIAELRLQFKDQNDILLDIKEGLRRLREAA